MMVSLIPSQYHYLALDVVFLTIAIVMATVLHRHFGTTLSRALANTFAVAAALCVLTAIFDSAIIAAGIVSYDDAKLSGIKVGLAPIEDFAYSLVAAVLAPALLPMWDHHHTQRMGVGHRHRSSEE